MSLVRLPHRRPAGRGTAITVAAVLVFASAAFGSVPAWFHSDADEPGTPRLASGPSVPILPSFDPAGPVAPHFQSILLVWAQRRADADSLIGTLAPRRTWRVKDLLVAEYSQVIAGQNVLNTSVRLFVHRSGRLVAALAGGVTTPPGPWPEGVSVPRRNVRLGRVEAEETQGWWCRPDGTAVPVRTIVRAAGGLKQLWIDTRTGDIVHERGFVAHGDVTGQVRGTRVAGWDAPFDPLDSIEGPLAHLSVNVSGSGVAVTDANGEFSIGTASPSPIVVAGLSGPYATVVNDAGPELQTSIQATPGVPVSLALGNPMDESIHAQVNAFVHTNRAHDWINGVAADPPFTALDFPLRARVNRQLFGHCTAGYDPSVPEMFFLPAGDDCPNTAYSTIVYHEYGHAIAFEIFGTFTPADMHEGIADTVSTYISESRWVGRDFYGIGESLRDVEYDLVFPAPGGIYQRGLVIAGSFHDLRTRFVHEYGPVAGRELAAKLFIETLYLLPTLINDDFVTTVLLADDDDGDLSNGTPNDRAIIESFQIHGLEAEPIVVAPLRFMVDAPAEWGWEFNWSIGAFYDEILVEKNGVPVATLEGNSTSWVDPHVTPGIHTYLFRGAIAGVESPATPRWIVKRHYVRGDANGDGLVSFDDVFASLDPSFLANPTCADALDVDDDGQLDLADIVFLLEYLFTDGPTPPSPFGALGFDPSPDPLPCAGEL